MKRVSVENDYTIEIWVPDNSVNGSRIGAEVVIKRTANGEIMAAFTQFTVGLDFPPTTEDAFARGYEAALARIGADFPPSE